MSDESVLGAPTASFAEVQEASVQDELQRDAAIIEQLLRSIQRAMRHSIEEDKSQGALTAPQLQAMTVLAQSSEPLTLKDLSERLELAHSTVSGIVDRLERRGLIHRVADSADRRYTRIEIAGEVKAYILRLPAQRLGPLLTALQQASQEERKTILEGLLTLQRLFLLTAESNQ